MNMIKEDLAKKEFMIDEEGKRIILDREALKEARKMLLDSNDNLTAEGMSRRKKMVKSSSETISGGVKSTWPPV